MSLLSFKASEQRDLFENDTDFKPIKARLTRRRGRPVTPIGGKRFGRLLAICPTRKGRDTHIFWICQCDCGRRVIVGGDQLRGGKSRSCGCLKRETARRRTGLKGLNFLDRMAHRVVDSESAAGRLWGANPAAKLQAR